VVPPASSDNAHRALDKRYDLAAILSRVETRRLDGGVAVRFRDRYLSVTLCAVAAKATAPATPKAAARNSGRGSPPRKKSEWMNGFWKKPGPSIAKAIEIANASS
jgi:hypothetical protein